ncbi:glycosyltransferase [Myxococcota bacterium]
MSDKINEVYAGELYGKCVQQGLRDRVHWMSSQVNGPRVLDIGCSQGIVAILLAREGFDVLGVDTDPDAIRRALADREKESEDTQKRLTFRNASIFDEPLDKASFDTILLGEIIEHLAQPDRLLEVAARLLAPKGLVVITTPFGILEDPDHKQTFFLSRFVELISPHFAIHKLQILDKRICFVGASREGAPDAPIELIRISEEGFAAAERAYLAELSELHTQYLATREQRDKAYAERDAVRKRLEKADAERDRLTKRLQDESTARAEIERRLQDRIAAHDKLEHQLKERATTITKLEQLLQEQIDACKQTEQRLEVERGVVAARDEQKSRLQRDLDATRAGLTQSEKLVAQAEQLVAQKEQLVAQKERYIQYRARQLTASYQQTTDMRMEAQGHLASVRYQLGDAVLRAALPSRNTILLPWNLVRLVGVGLQHRRMRGEPTHLDRLPFGIGKLIESRLPGFVRSSGSAATPSAATSGEAPGSETAPQDGVVPPVVASGVPAGADLRDATLSRYPREAVRAALDVRGWRTLEKATDLRVLSVLDEFSAACFGRETTLVAPGPDTWPSVMEYEHPDMLFVESAWKGNGGSWQYRVAHYANPPGRELPEMVENFKREGLPTVFWNKEDPVHFDQFLDSARLFDVVLTTDADKIETYRKVLGHDKVAALPFAAQPRLHAPLANSKDEARIPRACFAGSYYANRFSDRRVEMEMLLDAARAFGLDIFDRNHGMTGPGSQDFQFPERFQQHIKGGLPYEELVKAHSRYRIFLNVNSVVDSPTMFSRRIFELLACGTPIVSTYSRGIEELLGKDIVWMVRNEREASEAIETLLKDDQEWRRRRLAGIRLVMGKHTYGHRFAEILKQVGLGHLGASRERVLLVARAPDALVAKRVQDAFVSQSHKDAHLLVLCPAGTMNISGSRANISIEPADGDVEARVNNALATTKADWVGLLDPAAAYGRHYLADLMSATRYSNADVVGKAVNGGSEFAFAHQLSSHGCLLNCGAAKKFGLSGVDLFEGLETETMTRQGMRLFAVDHDQFDVHVPQWRLDDEMARAISQCEG